MNHHFTPNPELLGLARRVLDDTALVHSSPDSCSISVDEGLAMPDRVAVIIVHHVRAEAAVFAALRELEKLKP